VIHYVSNRSDVDSERIAIWGSSYSGGIAITAGAVDPRIKVVIAQVPFVSGRLTREGFPKALLAKIYNDRGETTSMEPTYIPIFPATAEEAENPNNGAVLGTKESWDHLQIVKERGHMRENKVTLQSFFHAIRAEPSAFITQLAPKPFFMVVALQDSLIDPQAQLKVFATAGEPKELLELDCGHFLVYRDNVFEKNIAAQIAFLKKHL
jgi:cephalosporin-C deacetylase-like acetyl esterase